MIYPMSKNIVKYFSQNPLQFLYVLLILAVAQISGMVTKLIQAVSIKN